MITGYRVLLRDTRRDLSVICVVTAAHLVVTVFHRLDGFWCFYDDISQKQIGLLTTAASDVLNVSVCQLPPVGWRDKNDVAVEVFRVTDGDSHTSKEAIVRSLNTSSGVRRTTINPWLSGSISGNSSAPDLLACAANRHVFEQHEPSASW
jgi:hypothetical protein